MKVASARVNDDTMAVLTARAAARAVSVGELIREAIEAYLSPEAVPVAEPVAPVVRARDCDHPRSRWLQLPNGVMCDKCALWLDAGNR